jgi:hypothetical protein
LDFSILAEPRVVFSVVAAGCAAIICWWAYNKYNQSWDIDEDEKP